MPLAQASQIYFHPTFTYLLNTQGFLAEGTLCEIEIFQNLTFTPTRKLRALFLPL